MILSLYLRFLLPQNGSSALHEKQHILLDAILKVMTVTQSPEIEIKQLKIVDSWGFQ